MYSAFFNSPPPSPKAQTYRRGPLPSSHKAFQPSAYTTARHRQHRSSSSSAARMSLSSLLAFAHLPDPSAHQRRRVGRLAVFLASLFVIAFVVVSRAGGEPQWLASLNARQVDAGASGPAVGYPASRAFYGRGEGREWNTRMAQGASPSFAVLRCVERRARPSEPALTPVYLSRAPFTAPLQAVAPAARPAFATSLVPASSPPLLPSEELAALVHFLVSNHHGSLPFDSSYSPATTPLRSDWVLDFEPGPAGPKRTAALRAFEREVWASAKFVVLGRLKTDRLFFEQTDEMLRTEYMLAPGELVMIDIDGRGASRPFLSLSHSSRAR